MTTINTVQVQWECQQLLNRVLVLMDSADWEELARCYAEDAVVSRPSDPDNPITGRQQILASFLARPPKTTCHLLANSVFTVKDENRVDATSRVLLMSGPAPSGTIGGFPVPADSALLAGTFKDSLIRVKDPWLIEKRLGGIELKYSCPAVS